MTDSLDYRYLTQDIHIDSVLLGRDFWEEGLTVEKLGFEGMSAKDVAEYFK
ncbi:hypothetical protein HQ586_09275 [Candidatus Bathyarchaeota archaeon]|nr:hypothetical protein [Candidatus Bathyarchaeota archaeon]